MAAKLSDAQIKMMRHIDNASTVSISWGQKASYQRAEKLVTLGMLVSRPDKSDVSASKYHLSEEGMDALDAIDGITHEVIEVEELDAPTDATLSDELPAYQEVVIPSFKEGDEVSIDGQSYRGIGTIRSFWGNVAKLDFKDGSEYNIGIAFLSHAAPILTAPTGPAPAERIALNTVDAAYCYMGMAPIVECLCKEHVMEREIAALKARVTELETELAARPPRTRAIDCNCGGAFNEYGRCVCSKKTHNWGIK